MKIGHFCQHIASSEFGTRFYIEKDPSLQLTISSYKRSILEKIIRIAEHFFKTFFVNIVPSSVDLDLFQGRIEQHRKTHSIFHYLSNTFGHKRVEREIKALSLPCEKIRSNDFILSKEDLQRLFPRFLMPISLDYEELLAEIISSDRSIQIRDEVNTRYAPLKELFKDITSISDCNQEQLQTLTDILIPFSSEEEAFLGYIPKKINSPEFALSHESYMRHIAYSLDHLRRVTVDKETWEFFSGKRFSQTRFRDNSILPHPDGFLKYISTVEKEGASKKIFVPFGKKNDALHAHILYQGTRGILVSDSLKEAQLTLREDFHEELGKNGVIATQEETAKCFKDLRNQGIGITLLGFSLGGAHAQRDTLLHSPYVDRLVTISSPGIDKQSCISFEKEKKLHHSRTIEVIHNIRHGDYITHVGEALFGATEDKSILENILITFRFYVDNNENLQKKDLTALFNDKREGEKDFFSTLGKAAKSHMWTPDSLLPNMRKWSIIEYSHREKSDIDYITGIVNRTLPGIHPTYEKVRKKIGRYILRSQEVQLI